MARKTLRHRAPLSPSILAALVAAVFCFPANAQFALCADRAGIIRNLQAQFQETTVSIGLANDGGMVEILVSPDGSTWTILITDPQGVSCLMAAGESWESIKPKTPLGDPL